MGVHFIWLTKNKGITVEIIHGDLSLLLDSLTAAGIIMRKVNAVDEITAILTIDRRFLRQLQLLCKRQNAQLRII